MIKGPIILPGARGAEFSPGSHDATVGKPLADAAIWQGARHSHLTSSAERPQKGSQGALFLVAGQTSAWEGLVLSPGFQRVQSQLRVP